MSEPLDYSNWTWEQHLAEATTLAAMADQLGGKTIMSELPRRLNDVQQVTARGWLHAKLAELKKPAPAAELAPLVEVGATPEAVAEPGPAAAAAPKSKPQARQRTTAS